MNPLEFLIILSITTIALGFTMYYGSIAVGCILNNDGWKVNKMRMENRF